MKDDNGVMYVFDTNGINSATQEEFTTSYSDSLLCLLRKDLISNDTIWLEELSCSQPNHFQLEDDSKQQDDASDNDGDNNGGNIVNIQNPYGVSRQLYQTHCYFAFILQI